MNTLVLAAAGRPVLVDFLIGPVGFLATVAFLAIGFRWVVTTNLATDAHTATAGRLAERLRPLGVVFALAVLLRFALMTNWS